jgi:hypothetical protein
MLLQENRLIDRQPIIPKYAIPAIERWLVSDDMNQ